MKKAATSSLAATRIFVSHSSKDQDFGGKLVPSLRQALGSNDAVWYDALGGLHAGDAWWRTIIRELTSRDTFIVVLSPDAMASPWVNDEITLAWKQKNSSSGKRIIPLLYRPCAIRADLATLPCVSFLPSRKYEDAFEELLALLSPQITSQQRSVPVKVRLSRRMVVAGLLAGTGLSITGGSIAFWLSHTRLTGTSAPAAPQNGLYLTYRAPTGVTAMAWSPDGQRIASISNHLQVWDAATGKHVSTYQKSTDAQSLSWSPDGKYIVTGDSSSDPAATILDTVTGNILLTYRGHFVTGIMQMVNDVAWSPDGRRIASAGNDATAQIWKAATGEHILTYRGHSPFFVRSVAWSPDGQRIASGGDDTTVQVWDAATGHHVLTYSGHFSIVSAVRWSPDGKLIASASDDGTVQVWDAVTGRHIFTYRGHADIVTSVAWSPDGKRIASGGGGDTTVQIWDATTGLHAFIYRGHSNLLTAVAWSRDGKRIASASYDGTVQIWGEHNVANG